MKRVIAYKRTCSMCRDIFIPDASMTPLPLSPRFPLPPPHLTLRGVESERSKCWFSTVWFTNMMLALIAKNYSKDARCVMSIEYIWCCSIIPIQDCLKVAWRQMSPQRFTRQGKIIRRCKQSRSSAKLICTSYPPSFSTIHLKWFQTTIKYSIQQ